MITLETAKQLKQLGFPQNTLLSYYELVNNEWEVELTENLTDISYEESFGVQELYAIPDFEQIWIQLPKHDQIHGNLILHSEFGVCYMKCNESGQEFYTFGEVEDSLDEDIAKLWLKLKQYD